MKRQAGVLDLQGDVLEHAVAFESFLQTVIYVKTIQDLDKITHLIIPGGESTAIGRLLSYTGLDKEIQNRVGDGSLAVYGTCAGAILLCKEVVSKYPVKSLNLFPAKIERNNYGSQLDSFNETLYFQHHIYNAVFIRAPKIIDYDKEKCRVFSLHNGYPVALSFDRMMISTCHPELCRPAIFHKYFLSL